MDELKNIWKSQPEQPGGLNPQPKTSRHRSSVVDKLRRSLRFELQVVAVTVVIVGITVVLPGTNWTLAISCLVTLALLGLFYLRHRQLFLAVRASDASLPFLSNLLRLATTFERHYLWTNVLAMPAVVFGFGLASTEVPVEELAAWKWWAMGSFTVVMEIFAVWYTRKMYGRHIRVLRELVRDLGANEKSPEEGASGLGEG